ncbi:hypothetical protein C1646_676401 [Rhizophagus diaphanus]|nr:hypothetical protein C1646_676401 [Rhizophagus diaphanus] [Rhizophagus sp. MUCL 43196]
MLNEYVASILHTALHIVRDDTKKDLSIRPQHETIGEKSSCRLLHKRIDPDKQLESSYEMNKIKRKQADEMISIISMVFDNRQGLAFLALFSSEIFRTSEAPFTIEFNKKALDENSEEFHALRKRGIKGSWHDRGLSIKKISIYKPVYVGFFF